MNLIKRMFKIQKQSNSKNQFEKQIRKASQYDFIEFNQ